MALRFCSLPSASTFWSVGFCGRREVKMRRDSLFWGAALIIFGVLLFLQAQGIIHNILDYFWPIALMLVGLWLVLGVYWKPTYPPGETFTIPLGQAQSVNYNFSHGVGQLDITGGVPA